MKLLFDIAAVAVIVIALSRIVATPAERWAHGRISIVAWIVAVLWINIVSHDVIVPVAGLLAIWYTHRINKPLDIAPKVPDLPYAEGESEEGGVASDAGEAGRTSSGSRS